MQITPKASNGLTHAFTVVVPAADLERQMETELQSLSTKVSLPGFRPGKIPMGVLKKKYAKDVMGDVLETSVNKAVRQVIDEKKLRPSTEPDVKINSFEEGEDLSFDVAIEVLPDMPVMDYSKLSITEYEYDIPADEVGISLERLAKTRQHTHPYEGAAALGNVVKIDFVGKTGGTAFDGGTAKGFFLELGSNQFIPGFEDQLVGVKAGDERQVKVTFPKEYHSAALAGEDATFDVTVHEVLRLHVPDIDNKLAESLGFKDLDALKGAIGQQIDFEYQRAARNKAKKELFDALDEKLSFEIPPKMFAMEFEAIWKSIEQARKSGDPSLKGRTDEDLKAEYEPIAKRRVKLGLFLSEVARQMGIQVTREEISAAVMTQARQYPGQEEKIFEFYRKNPGQVDGLKGPILEEKAVDFILSQAGRVKKKVSVEALMKDDDADASGTDSNAKPAKKAAKKK